MKNIILDIQIACSNKIYRPEKKDFEIWLKKILKDKKKMYEITIRIVDKTEIQEMNLKYRGKKKPTNILSFTYSENEKKSVIFLGDLIICNTILQEEAKIQKKLLKSHWAHIIIHGTLHLLGYNHENHIQQKKMEFLETNIMLALGYQNPYLF
ncbi:rRNA maturation RNase YbeY [Buchnera aphidicola (Pemphigus obesinymphae)]|uniref:rRNA maturation RNase YbeY n=1 Tax=Buchnera aphidicola TaxID=9 RepID=UPI0022373B54|nr:rRNA maturation RNase YbeY [Buchnera aphidicola]MCW5196353.1 rRNA maturation RNase YbeY [Buchnera aphidicola (Pemphigus obesinymphae)]